MVWTLLVVCAGNICLSPMAEALFRHRLKKRPALAHVDVAPASRRPRPPSRAFVSCSTFDIATHRARLFGRHLQAYRILPVDRWTTDHVHALGVSDPVEMLRDFVGTGEEVEDPYGGATEGYRRSLRQLDRLVDAAIDRLESAVAP